MYDYERLGDEGFQQLCQSLLVREYQGVQCLAVGMPDGGRDALIEGTHTKGFVAFQVKMNRSPDSTEEVVEWVKKAVDGELSKVRNLIKRGMSSYVLICNVPGTSHLDGGRVDRVRAYLKQVIDIPAICWWREDLDRRLDGAYDLKLRYPDLLNGPDVIRLLWESTASGDAARRRQAALYSYVADQYAKDATVRFKQIELVSRNLFDLFVDVPARYVRDRREYDSVQHGVNAAIHRSLQGSDTIWSGSNVYQRTSEGYEPAEIGAAQLLQDPGLADIAPSVVLEGAPGQGKSTLTQYLAQIHRVRILEKKLETARLPKEVQSSPLAIPLRIELRDVALWLNGLDPWSQGHPIEHNGPRTLEGALAGHIERRSGGHRFDVTDLHIILSSCPSILLLDALDEVADVDDRAAVLSAITDTLNRFRGNQVAPRAIVTTRPTVLAGQPIFKGESFAHLTLAPIRNSLALAYCDKWAKAQRIPVGDRSDLRQTLRLKMQSAHVAELARNTMQLSILLSLLHLRGANLPDKRTELYNAYFDIFLNRESEKNAIVRDNRQLLIDLHRYLGFFLHAQAEREKTSGRIAHEDLQRLLSTYLTAEGQPHVLLESLLTGMVERFGALVSRVEGTYEFEVQPLREYFGGKYLYDTAPYSPTGRESRGTKPDRFDGIAPNPYWLNVTRFFAGCFSKGELADLADRVCDLIASKRQKNLPYARRLAVALLKDWVFSQSPKATRRVVRAVFDDIGLQWTQHDFLTPDSGKGSESMLLLPRGAGAEELVELCWEWLSDERLGERAEHLCRLIRLHAPRKATFERWREALGSARYVDRSAWIQFGTWLDVQILVPASDVWRLMNFSIESDTLKYTTFVAGRAPVSGLGQEELGSVARSILDVCAFTDGLPRVYMPSTPMAAFAQLVDPANWLTLKYGHVRIPIRQLLDRRVLAIAKSELPRNATGNRIRRAMDRIRGIWERDLAHSLDPWTDVLGLLDRSFGRSWTGIELGVISGSISNPSERGRGASRLLFASHPLPHRIRFARRMAKDRSWWRSQLAEATDEYDLGLWILSVIAWASPEVISSLLHEIDEGMISIGSDSQQRLIAAGNRMLNYARWRSIYSAEISVGSTLSMPTVLLLFSRLDRDTQIGLVRGRLARGPYELSSASLSVDILMQEALFGRYPSMPGDSLSLLRDAFNAGGVARHYRPGSDLRMKPLRRMADEILGEGWSLPATLIRYTTYSAQSWPRRPVPVSILAEAEGWFDIS